MNSDVTIYINGKPTTVPAGRSLVSVLWSLGLVPFRTNPVSGEARAPFCGMGACFECEAEISGCAEKRTCLVEVQDGMRIQVQEGNPHEG